MSALPGSGLLAMAAEMALNAAIEGSSAARADLKRLEGKVIAFELMGLPLKFYFLPQPGRLTVAADYHGDADIHVSAPPASLFTSALQRDDAPPKGMQINGDAETAQIFSRLLKQADLDWEELLSRHTGDVAAHEIGKAVRGLHRWGRDAASRLGLDLAEYLQYESRDLPARREVEEFLTGVDRLRDDTERLEARLKRTAARARP
ncbi:MAG TPA: SCP2 sterol-binding domain-containing protein [Gammaproteobacteria bacterium]|nr:SCP2 sterol-binding domain-containing protein [Gammaproteobacteria bacterium]